MHNYFRHVTLNKTSQVYVWVQETGGNSEFLLLVFLLVYFVRNHSRCAACEHICLLTVKCSWALQVSEAFENHSKDWNLNVRWDPVSLCGCPPCPEPAELAGCIYSACVTTNSRPVHHCRVNDALVSQQALPIAFIVVCWWLSVNGACISDAFDNHVHISELPWQRRPERLIVFSLFWNKFWMTTSRVFTYNLLFSVFGWLCVTQIVFLCACRSTFPE